jgi:FkbM family methyltransferase
MTFFVRRHGQLSFSQCGEDLIVKFYFEARGKRTISYLDIGANHPWKFNNTALFYRSGSRGVSVEPDPDLHRVLNRERRGDVNLNVAIDSSEREVEFFLFQEHTMNTMDPVEAQKNIRERGFHLRRSVMIRTQTLPSILDRHFGGRYPDFLSIDAEGLDERIVSTLDESRELPAVICIETVGYTTDMSGTKNTAIFDVLRRKQYKVFADTYVNTIFVRE